MHSFFALCTPMTPSHQRIRTIVQLTTHTEGGRRKADPYIPLSVGPNGALHFSLPPLRGTSPPGDSAPTIEVTLLGRKTLEEAEAIQNTLQVRLIGWNATSATTNGNS